MYVAVISHASRVMCSCTASMGHMRLIFDTALSDAWIWILLTRHVADTKQTSDYISLRIELEEGAPIPSSRLTNEQTLAKDVSNDLDVSILLRRDQGTFINGIHFLVRQSSALHPSLIPRATGQSTSSKGRRCFFDYRVL